MARKKSDQAPASGKASDARVLAAMRRSEAAANKRVDAEQALLERRWAMAKARFETDPRHTLSSIARELGVSRQRVHDRKEREGWVKALEGQGPSLNAAAQTAANPSPPAELVDLAQKPIPPAPQKPKDPPPQDPLSMAPTPPPDLSPEAQAQAITGRADVLTKHRSEWKVVRGLLSEALKARDGEKAKLAKIFAESLKITQDGERKAWGLDVPEVQTGQVSVRVVVEREQVAPAVVVDMESDDA